MEAMTAPRVLAIDPGPTESAWLFYEHGEPQSGGFGKSPNEWLLEALRKPIGDFATFKTGLDVVVIELIEPRYGLQMGWETLNTARYIGQLEEAARPLPVAFLKRSEILRHLGVVTSVKKGEKKVSADSGVRMALMDRFGGPDALGRKAAPGPLYGISKDVWAALSVAVTFVEKGASA